MSSELILGAIRILIGIIGILIGWIWWRNEGKKKKIEYKILGDTNLIDINKNIQDEISIKFKDKNIQTLRMLSIKFKNTGKLPILKSDFDTPIKIQFKQPSNVFKTFIKTEPDDLKTELNPIEINQENEKIIGLHISPILLNTKDSFEVTFLMDSLTAFKIESRIVGVKKINQVEYFKDSKYYRFTLIENTMLALSIFSIALVLLFFRPPVDNSGLIQFETIFFLAASFIFGTIHLFFRESKVVIGKL